MPRLELCKVDAQRLVAKVGLMCTVGITAFKRANGEYLVFVEEDLRAKVIMYRLAV